MNEQMKQGEVGSISVGAQSAGLIGPLESHVGVCIEGLSKEIEGLRINVEELTARLAPVQRERKDMAKGENSAKEEGCPVALRILKTKRQVVLVNGMVREAISLLEI